MQSTMLNFIRMEREDVLRLIEQVKKIIGKEGKL